MSRLSTRRTAMITIDQITEIIQPYEMTFIRTDHFYGDIENVLVELATSHGIFVRIYRDRRMNDCEIAYQIKYKDWLNVNHIFEIENITDSLDVYNEADFQVYFESVLPIIQRHMNILSRYANRKYYEKKQEEIRDMNKRKFEEKFPGCWEE